METRYSAVYKRLLRLPFPSPEGEGRICSFVRKLRLARLQPGSSFVGRPHRYPKGPGVCDFCAAGEKAL